VTWRPDNRLALENDLPREEIADKVTGRAKYTTDYYPAGLLWAGYVRCPYGRANLASADVAAAQAVPGVLEIVIDKEEGRYPGDRLGHICATSRHAYEEGLAALNPQFVMQRPKTQIERERTPLADIEAGAQAQRVEAMLAESAFAQESEYGTEVQTHVCLEPHIMLVDFRGDHALAWGSTQSNFSSRDDLAVHLGLNPEKVEFHCEHVGGGFGSKFGAGPEGLLAARMSRKYQRPCRVALTRKEEHLDSGMRPGSRQYMKVGVGEGGRITAARIHTWGSVGPSGRGGGAKNPSRYDFGEVAKTHEDVHLNSGFPRPMRAPGHPQGIFAVEMMLDELAARVGMDPLELRKRNDPNETRLAMFEVGADLIGWGRRQPAGTTPGPVKRGFGVGVGSWYNSTGRATIDVHVHRSGTVEALSGSQDIGTGFRTVLRDVVAHQLGIPARWVEPKVGGSSYPPGPASGGSVTSRFTAPRMFAAAEKAKRELLLLIAEEWGVEPAQIAIRDGVLSDGQRSMGWADACRRIREDRITVRDSRGDEGRRASTESEAVQFAEVEVDTETGVVRVVKVVALQEMGQPVNRMTAENQIIGAVTQGVSYALFENRVLDRRTGAVVNANMDLYKLAGSVDVPEIVPVIWTQYENAPVNSLGEPPVVPTAGAVGCAVANALGVPVRALPLTPARVLEALERT